MFSFIRLYILFCLFFLAFNTFASLKLPEIFGDGMVLQRNQPIKVWGWASKGEALQISIHDQDQTVIANDKGEWSVELGPKKAGGPYQLTVRGANSVLLFEDVMIGEVWVCSGQSNMAWPIRGSADSTNVIANAQNPRIRMVKIPRKIAGTPQDDFSEKVQWRSASSENAPDFSAVAYFYGRRLEEELDVTVGLIDASLGGAIVETYISKKAYDNNSAFEKLITDSVSNILRRLKNAGPNDYPTLLFNYMIHPLVQYPIAGVIWYQGESNVFRAHEYRQTFPLLINDWRDHWKRSDLPFYFVQLSSFKGFDVELDKDGYQWPELREAQAKALLLPYTGMVVTIDLGERDDIHPKNKKDVGERLAELALHETYRKNVAFRGPRVKNAIRKGKNMVLSFTYARGLHTKGESEVRGFEVAGEDGDYKSATASIRGKRIFISHPHVDKPVMVRYAWRNDASNSNVYNSIGRPLAPFRTDSLPSLTQEKRYKVGMKLY